MLLNNFSYIIDELLPSNFFHINIFFNIGSKDENEVINGISHLLEHLLFHLQSPVHRIPIYKILEKEGIRFNATTSIEYTRYVFFAPINKLDLLLNIIRLIITETNVSQLALKKEKNIVIHELCGGSESNFLLLMQYLLKKILNIDTPIGTIDNVTNITQELITKFKNKYYSIDNCHLYVHANNKNFYKVVKEKIIEYIPELTNVKQNIFNSMRINTKINKSVNLIDLIKSKQVFSFFDFFSILPISEEEISQHYNSIDIGNKKLEYINKRNMNFCKFNGNIIKKNSTYFSFCILIDITKLYSYKNINEFFEFMFIYEVIRSLIKDLIREKHHLLYKLNSELSLIRNYKFIEISGRANSTYHLYKILNVLKNDMLKLTDDLIKKTIINFKNGLNSSNNLLCDFFEEYLCNLVLGIDKNILPKEFYRNEIIDLKLYKKKYIDPIISSFTNSHSKIRKKIEYILKDKKNITIIIFSSLKNIEEFKRLLEKDKSI